MRPIPKRGGDHSETAATTGDKEDKADEKDESDTVTTTDSVDNSADDSTDDSTDETADDSTDNSADETDPDADLNDSEQGEDGDASEGDADEPKDEDGENAPETSPEPGAEGEETETDEDDATGETDEADDANADINLLSVARDVDLDASDDSEECAHTNVYKNESYEPTGVVTNNNDENKHLVHYTYRWETTCLDCGEELPDHGEKDVTEAVNHSFTKGSDGSFKCEACGYSFTCNHDGSLTTITTYEPDDADNAQKTSDPMYHEIEVYKWEQSLCTKCGWRGDKTKVEGSATYEEEPHEWVEKNGKKVCLKCDYENECQHEDEEYVEEWNDVIRATKIDGYTHSALCGRFAVVKCADCGLIVDDKREIDSWPETQDHTFNEFSNDGTVSCADCGYVVPCKHPAAYVEELSTEGVGYKEAEQVNEKQHRVRRYVQTYKHCKICGHEWGWDYPDDDTVKIKLENHQWNDENVCEICGYENTCKEHTYEFVETGEKWDGTYDCIPLDAYTHQVTLGVIQEKRCVNCGFTTVDFNKDPKVTYVEEHSWLPDGSCEVCGAKGFCQHPAAYVEKVTGTVSRGDLGAIDNGDDTHTVYADRYVEYHCKRCETWWGYEVTKYGIGLTEEHVWDSDNARECVICGHENPCGHDTTEEFQETRFRPIPSKTTATTHTLETYVIAGTRCTECGAEFGCEYLDEWDDAVTEPHKFVHQGGQTVCEVCGYIKPEQKGESSKKTETQEEPVFEEIAEGTVVHGVTVGEPTRMGVTMVQAMAGIAAEYGADAKIEIQNIDKVLTADECAALNALQPTERILVALSAIGYGDEVKNALEELQLTLSEEARVLNLKVNTRVALMDDAAKAAYQKAIERYFPNANGVAITLEIRKAGETGARLERYGFTPSTGEWVFAKLEVANA